MASRLQPAGDPDFAPTPPWGGRAVCEAIRRLDPHAVSAREPAAGAGHLAHGLRRTADFADGFAQVRESDLCDYGRGLPCFDWLSDGPDPCGPPCDWVVTNPPFGDRVIPFARASLRRARRGSALLLPLRCLAGVARWTLFRETGFSACLVFAERLPLHMGRWEAGGKTATDYAWFLWLAEEAEAASPMRAALAGARAAGGWLGLHAPPGSRARLTRPSDAAFACGGAG